MNIDYIRFRSEIVRAIRRFFDSRGFLEVQTPRLVGLPGQEPYLEPMWTVVSEESGAEHPAALITSPEYAMKKLLGAGMDRIYDLGSCFRNGEPWDGTHDPEFLLLEWYRKNADLEDLLMDTEAMVREVFDSVAKRSLPLDRNRPFRRLTVCEAMRLYANVDLDAALEDRSAMASIANAHGQTVCDTDSWDDLFFKVFLSEVEPHLGWSSDHSVWEPTFLTHYPRSMAALARRDEKDARYALRTEFYIGDFELANGFAELADPTEQRARFEEEQALRTSLGKKTWPIDEAFLSALPGMGNAAGIAFGVDRLVMLAVGASSMKDILPISVRERFS